ncbi:PTS sugar transporter subunit IIC [Vulgatibacter sp.]|uniref:PTS sugar transporter subunit IIC n=1 Tax=Vulgatibacter sp. TaxID=1971226 RepID=UPI003568B474
MTQVAQLLLAALVAGLAAVERKGLLQAQLSRPIVVAPLVGWALGDPLAGLYVGAPLELIWIGAANLGAALPPHETAATAAITAAAVAAGGWLTDFPGATAAMAFVVFGPVAVIGRRLEGVGERANENLVAHAAVALGESLPRRAFRLHLLGLWRPFVTSFALVLVAGGVVGPLLRLAQNRLPDWSLAGFEIGWMLLWAVGGAAAVRAARLPRGLGLAAAGAAGAIALWAAASWFGWVGVIG